MSHHFSRACEPANVCRFDLRRVFALASITLASIALAAGATGRIAASKSTAGPAKIIFAASNPYEYSYPENAWVKAGYPSCAMGYSVGGVQVPQSPIDFTTVTRVTSLPSASVELSSQAESNYAPALMTGSPSATAPYFSFILQGATSAPQITFNTQAVIGTQSYQVQSYHFHSPPEHILANGGSNPPTMEMHILTTCTSGSCPYAEEIQYPTVVFAVLFNEPAGNTSTQMTPILNLLGGNTAPGSFTLTNGSNGPLDMFTTGPFWTYLGSLTTPPCAGQSVPFYVATNMVALPPGTAASFQNLQQSNAILNYPTNARAVQPIGSNPIYQYNANP